MYIYINLGKKLDEKGMSHREFAKRTGVRHPTISALCNNTVKHIPLENLAAICRELECEPGDLLELKTPGK
ncbi:helix-turn-helix transcriptional regulator [Metabacillus idriensis]|uniref:helix-turn-helix domain-containing protein n=1 Tax=Metabacillus idriensis TaxID=324768 RepID=UPI002041FE1A|nr:helix-turn-helix transcriptional regulator [Metabacillus idriensis]MCM3598712.1 helix-turn-helix transcriptional regulator [Metabacillus idriensis]